MNSNPCDIFFIELDTWQQEMILLRKLLLSTGLKEEYKWKQPCYTDRGKNIVILGTFKESCILSFFKGSLLQDAKKLLEFPGPNAREGKLFRFRSLEEIMAIEDYIKTNIFEAIEIERQGLEVPKQVPKDLNFPDELSAFLNASAEHQEAWDSLTPGRQKGFLLHFNQAKQSETRKSRIQKAWPRIKLGKGMQDCICGKSKRMPRCDGSHNL